MKWRVRRHQETPTTVEARLPWAKLDEARKRNHLAFSHGYRPADEGGWDPAGPEDDPRGSDAWVSDGRGTVAELDDLHAEDHAMMDGGGGPHRHEHANV